MTWTPLDALLEEKNHFYEIICTPRLNTIFVCNIPSTGALSKVTSVVFGRFFLGLVFSLAASLLLPLLCGEDSSEEGEGSTPGTQFSSGSSISGAMGLKKKGISFMKLFEHQDVCM